MWMNYRYAVPKISTLQNSEYILSPTLLNWAAYYLNFLFDWVILIKFFEIFPQFTDELSKYGITLILL